MYIIYCLFSSIFMALIYEYSGLDGIGIRNVLLSLFLFLAINLIISKPYGNYKRNITIFSVIITILSICNALKVRFQLAEISFFDVKLAKAAGDIAGLFMDKLPYVQIAIMLFALAFVIIITKKYADIFESIITSRSIQEQNDIEDLLERMDDFFCSKFIKLAPISIMIIFFAFTNEVSANIATSSFGDFLISGKSMTKNYIVKFENKDKIIKRVVDTAKNDELSKLDANDPLLKGYPFNRQKDVDLVIIQSETFFDLPKYKDKLEKNGIIIQDDNVNKNFNYYQKKGISGSLYVPTVGGGTVNTEYEVMTGYGAKYFSRGSIVFTSVLQEPTNSLAHFMKEFVGNAKTIGIHNHNKEYWDRDRVYPLLGIDEYVDMTMFTKEQQEDLVGAWMSDKTIFDMTIQKLEENPAKNVFLLPVTVQNHGPFLEKRGDVKVENLSEKDNWEISNFVANLKYSDEELKKFMDYIDSRQKPTIVVFYGDHKPDPNYEIFANSQYYNENNKQNLFNTDYFIYFNKAVNDPKLLALKGSTNNISAISLNRYIQMLLGDSSALSMYIYNYAKKEENYFDNECISGAKDSIYRDISLNFINKLAPYGVFE